jgi:ABC-2 type transport system permease protein
MADILAAEWRKLRTAASTRYVLGAIAVLTALMPLIAVYFVGVWDSLPSDAQQRSALGSLPVLMGWIASLCLAVFGALAITSEYGSGMIRTTFTVVPRRTAVLGAKGLAVGVAAFIVAELSFAITELSTVAIIGGRQIAGQVPPGPGEARLIIAMGLSCTTFALIGLSLGAITRSALASVVTLALVWYIVPLVAGHLAAPWNGWLMSIVPGALAGELVGGDVNAFSVFGSALPPWAALLAMVAYAVIPLSLAMVLVEARDA